MASQVVLPSSSFLGYQESFIAKPLPPPRVSIMMMNREGNGRRALAHPLLFSSSFHHSPGPCQRASFSLRAMSQSTGTFTQPKQEDNLTETSSPLSLTFLEGNSWLWTVKGINILVDPVLVGNLDFGIPWLYDAAKKTLKEFTLDDLPELDLILITQSLDDHCHIKTLDPLSKKFPDVQVISTPNAEPTLSKLFQKVIYLDPGQSTQFNGKNELEITICASEGPVLGPPWQRPENGYIIKSASPELSLYYEPHCVFNSPMLEKERVDVVITPVIKQQLPAFTLVYGQEDAVKLAQTLKAKIVVTMNNGDLESHGFLAKILAQVGTTESFKDMLKKVLPDVQVLVPSPGIPLEINV